MSTYRAWNPTLVTPESQIVNELLLHAHPTKKPLAEVTTEALPPPSVASCSTDSGRDTVTEENCDLDTELQRIGEENSAEIREMCVALEIDTRCNLCAIVSICLRRDAHQKWLLDYSLLCQKSSAAPRTAMATLITATEFLYLLQLHFKDIQFDNIFRERIVTIFDFHTHFFINRCYAHRDEHPLIAENITLAHMAVMRALLTEEDSVPYTKSRRLQYKLPKKSTKEKKTASTKATTRAAAIAAVTAMDEEEEGIHSMDRFRRTTNGTFAMTLFYIWSGTNVMFNTSLTDLAIKKTNTLKKLRTRQSEIEPCYGPVYLSPVPVFRLRNATTTVCLLCELMTCSEQNNLFLRKLYERITNYSQNNLKMIDRTQLVLAEIMPQTRHLNLPTDLKNKDMSSYLTNAETLVRATSPGTKDPFELDAFTYLILRQVGVVGVYKHFFADPLCAANIRATDTSVLFFDVPNEYLNEVKLAICSTNTYPSSVERDFWLYAILFKAFQLIQKNYKTKTQMNDFLRDFCQVIETHQFPLVDPHFTINKYV